MTGLRLSLLALLLLALTVALLRSCGVTEPVVIPDWEDSLRVVRTAYQIENAAHRAEVERERATADSLRQSAETWRHRAQVRPARPQPHGVATPDSNPTGLQAQIDSLWAALDASDSAYASLESAYFAEQRRSAAALAGWAAADTALARHDAISSRAIADLTDRLRTAQRGCRVLGLLPCPTLSAGYGATLSGGQVHAGPTVAITVPVRF